jgi:broad specificity phosphatase PhoE
MSKLRRIVLVRHGETVGNSSVRFHGSTDVALSDEGRLQMREASKRLVRECFDLVVASTLRRSWEGASIVGGGAPVRLEPDFREIHFGRWEGLTREEIEAQDPALYAEWQQHGSDFEFPGGEPRAEFRARVLRGLERVQETGATSALLVVHKGILRTVARALAGDGAAEDEIALGGAIELSRGPDDVWRVGRRGSNPEGVATAAPEVAA